MLHSTTVNVILNAKLIIFKNSMAHNLTKKNDRKIGVELAQRSCKGFPGTAIHSPGSVSTGPGAWTATA